METFTAIWKKSQEMNKEVSGQVIDEQKHLGAILHEGHDTRVFIDQFSENTFHTHIIEDGHVDDNVHKFGCDLPSFDDYTAFIHKAYISRVNFPNGISDTVISKYGTAKLIVTTSFFEKWSEEQFDMSMTVTRAYFYWLSGLTNAAFLTKEQYLKLVEMFRPSFMSKIVENFIQVEGQGAYHEIIKGFGRSDVVLVFPLRFNPVFTDICMSLDDSTGIHLELSGN